MLEDVSLKGCIQFAIVTEELGVKFYGRLAKTFAGDQEIANLFELLSKDEQEHKEQFSKLLQNLPEEVDISHAPEQIGYLRAMSISEFFSQYQGPFIDVEKIQDRDDALQKAFRFERATLGFYHAVQDVVGEKPALTQIIEAEKSHVTRLLKVMITGEKFRSLQDKWP